MMALTQKQVADWAFENGYVLIQKEPRCPNCGGEANAVHYLTAKQECRVECEACLQNEGQGWFEY